MSMGTIVGYSPAADEPHLQYAKEICNSWLDYPELNGQIKQVMQLSPWEFADPDHVLKQVMGQAPIELQFFSSLEAIAGSTFTTVTHSILYLFGSFSLSDI